MIADCTGHRSTKALRQYEHTSAKQPKAAGLAVANETTYTPGDVKERKPLAQLNQDSAAQLKQDPAAAAAIGSLKSLPTFSGLQNCIINANLQHHYCFTLAS